MTIGRVLRVICPWVVCACAERPPSPADLGGRPIEPDIHDAEATAYELSTSTNLASGERAGNSADASRAVASREAAADPDSSAGRGATVPDSAIAMTQNPVEAGSKAVGNVTRVVQNEGRAEGGPSLVGASFDGSATDSNTLDVSDGPSDCAHTLSCLWAQAPEDERCLEKTRRDAMAQLQAVLDCQRTRCRDACSPNSWSRQRCETCLVLRCAPALETCRRSGGCGDGSVDSQTETCDDGNSVSTDGCTNSCTRAVCGDGIVSPAKEQCDDGNDDDGDTCLSQCVLSRCGDGVLRRGVEGCDDGNERSGDGCSATCALESCGNGLVEPPEECDDGASNGLDRPCLDTCRVNRCGDGRTCSNADAGCGVAYGSETEDCDDGNDRADDGCNACRKARCGDGVVDVATEECDDGNLDPFDSCGNCRLAADHLLITEIAVSPAGAEMIEIYNPTARSVDLSEYGLSDSARYAEVVLGTFSTASGSDFVARFPAGWVLGSGAYLTVAIANADGPGLSFRAAYGRSPDFELRPTANGASDTPSVPNMESVTSGGSTIGSSASLTDGGEPVVLFRARTGQPVEDVDYVYYGRASSSNPSVDKTGLVVQGYAYAADTPGAAQHAIAAPAEGGSLHRCVYAEANEKPPPSQDAGPAPLGNGVTGHDETAEDWQRTFAVNTSAPEQRTPGAQPPSDLCRK